MRRPTKPDPYCRFKDDDQRRRALATRVRWWATTLMVIAVCDGREYVIGSLQSLWNALS